MKDLLSISRRGIQGLLGLPNGTPDPGDIMMFYDVSRGALRKAAFTNHKRLRATVAATGASVPINVLPGVEEIDLLFTGVSTTGTNAIVLTLNGESSGYSGTAGTNGATGGWSTSAVLHNSVVATNVTSGVVMLRLADLATQNWAISSQLSIGPSGTDISRAAGSKALGAPLRSIEIVTGSAFDAGSFALRY